MGPQLDDTGLKNNSIFIKSPDRKIGSGFIYPYKEAMISPSNKYQLKSINNKFRSPSNNKIEK